MFLEDIERDQWHEMIWAERGYVNIWEGNKQFSSFKRHVQKWHGNLGIVTVRFRGKYHGAKICSVPGQFHIKYTLLVTLQIWWNITLALIFLGLFQTHSEQAYGCITTFLPWNQKTAFHQTTKLSSDCIIVTVETLSVSLVNKLTKLYQLW